MGDQLEATPLSLPQKPPIVPQLGGGAWWALPINAGTLTWAPVGCVPETRTLSNSPDVSRNPPNLGRVLAIFPPLISAMLPEPWTGDMIHIPSRVPCSSHLFSIPVVSLCVFWVVVFSSTRSMYVPFTRRRTKRFHPPCEFLHTQSMASLETQMVFVLNSRVSLSSLVICAPAVFT